MPTDNGSAAYQAFLLMIRRPPRSARFPYATLFRSCRAGPPPSPFGARRSCPAVPGRDPRGERELARGPVLAARSDEHTSELQSCQYLVCRLLLEKKIIPSSSIIRSSYSSARSDRNT